MNISRARSNFEHNTRAALHSLTLIPRQYNTDLPNSERAYIYIHHLGAINIHRTIINNIRRSANGATMGHFITSRPHLNQPPISSSLPRATQPINSFRARAKQLLFIVRHFSPTPALTRSQWKISLSARDKEKKRRRRHSRLRFMLLIGLCARSARKREKRRERKREERERLSIELRLAWLYGPGPFRGLSAAITLNYNLIILACQRVKFIRASVPYMYI